MTIVQSIQKRCPLLVIQGDDASAVYGLPVAEDTLRTPAALRVMETMASALASAFPDLLVGAGTVLAEGQVDAVVDAQDIKSASFEKIQRLEAEAVLQVEQMCSVTEEAA